MKGPSEEEIILFVLQNSCPFVTTNDVAQEFPSVSKRTVRKRLNNLVDKGQLEKREVGANSIVWYTPT